MDLSYIFYTKAINMPSLYILVSYEIPLFFISIEDLSLNGEQFVALRDLLNWLPAVTIKIS